MSKRSGYIVFLDANVLYPASVRSFLLHIAVSKIYQPKWTDEVHTEWIRNLLVSRPDLKERSLESATTAMNKAFPDANVTDYEELVAGLSLPDDDDRHVLAAAIRCGANLIVTNNTKDFPSAYLSSYDIEVLTPDDFILRLLETDKEIIREALSSQVESLKNPPKTAEEILEILKKCGLSKTVNYLKSIRQDL